MELVTKNKNTMKEFNLEQAKAGKPVCTKNGHKVRILCFDKLNSSFPIVVLLKLETNEVLETYDLEGHISTGEHGLDLMMGSKGHEGWVNIYPEDSKNYRACVCIYPNKLEAFNRRPSDCVATVKVEWEG